jgi:hypothetical protein
VVETCTRTIHGLPLLRPSPEANERIVGALGRAAEYYGVDVYAFGCTSNHYHALFGTRHGLQMSRFQCHLNSNIAREVGRLHDWPDKFWSRRYRAMMISNERMAQRACLKYVLAQGTKEGLVERPFDWPGPNSARALVHGEPMVGYWFNRSKEYYARRKGLDFEKYDFATRYEIELQRLPAFQDDSPDEYRAMVAELLCEIEEEAAGERQGRPVLGADRVLAQDPHQRMGKSKKSPAPMLFFTDRPEIRTGMANDYKDFCDQYDVASRRLVEAAVAGARLDPSRHFPDGSFPSSLIEELLRSVCTFNPEVEFPDRSFPRPWPFVGGRLPKAPGTPPSRRLVYLETHGEVKISWRGEIPTVRLPRPARDPPRPARDPPSV